MLLFGGADRLTERLARELGGAPGVIVVRGPEPPPEAGAAAAAVYLAAARGGERPDVDDAARVFAGLAAAGCRRVVVVASAAVNEPSHHHPGLLSEDRLLPRRNRNPIAAAWLRLEEIAGERLDGAAVVTVLRPTPSPVAGGRDHASRLFAGGWRAVVPGYDPSLQVLAPADLARAIRLAIGGRAGVYNVAPAGVVPLRRGLRLTGGRRLPIPLWLQRPIRALLAPSRRLASPDQLQYLRYPWTVSNRKIAAELGFRPRLSSAEALLELRREARGEPAPAAAPAFDDFGMDKDYIAAYGRTLFKFLHDHYWRVELDGLEHVPRRGRGVLVGVHRGFMPWDGVMALFALVREAGRYPRFLLHPTLVKFPFLANYMTKLGGILACRENADWVLERDGLLGMFPEGIRGAFSYYRDAYQLKKFGRDEFVRAALRHQAPIIPFVTVGSAEIYPILAKLDWGWWKRYSEWPCLPITPTFPLLPVPLPSKWHTRFLEPLPVAGHYPPEAADDRATVRAISRRVRSRIEAAIRDMLQRRRSIFYGTIFEEQPA